MCLFPTPSQAAPTLPAQVAQLKQPDNAAASGAGSKMADQLRARSSTILTSGSGVTANAPTEKKTLLGQ